jgi:hypothetical protein
MALNTMLRIKGLVGFGALLFPLLEGPLNPIPIGPVTFRMMILEKLKFSMLALPALILIGQP